MWKHVLLLIWSLISQESAGSLLVTFIYPGSEDCLCFWLLNKDLKIRRSIEEDICGSSSQQKLCRLTMQRMDESAMCVVNRADNLWSFVLFLSRRITRIDVPYPSVFVFGPKAVAWTDVDASGGKDSVYLGLQWRGSVPGEALWTPIGNPYQETRQRNTRGS